MSKKQLWKLVLPAALVALPIGRLVATGSLKETKVFVILCLLAAGVGLSMFILEIIKIFKNIKSSS